MKQSRGVLCLATPEYPPVRWGGLAATVERVARHAASMGYVVHVAHFLVREGPLPLLDDNVSARRDGDVLVHDILVGREDLGGRPLGVYDCPHAMTLLMMHQSLELLHMRECFDGIASFFAYPVGYVAGLLARTARLPHLACVVGNDIHKYAFSPERAFLVRSVLAGADHVVAMSRRLLDLADAITPVACKASVIFNSVEPGPARREPARRNASPSLRLGCAGIFKYAKGLPYLLKALARLRQEHDILLEVVGELRPEEVPVFEDLLDRCGVREAVNFRGVVPRQEMPGWYAGLDAYVLPSLSEGCPNVLLEAMATGLPCVATRVGAVEDIVEDGVSGLTVPPGNSEALARALGRLAVDPALRRRLGHAARAGMAGFSPERERQEWEAAFAGIMGG